MKFFFTIVTVIFISSTYGQVYVGQSSNTWYVNAPTSGCNGIWAINTTLWPACTGGCTYAAASPSGCLTTVFPGCDSIVGDTLYLKICSLPCNIMANCGTSSATCGTGTLMTTSIPEFVLKKSKIFPNPSNGQLQLDYQIDEQKTGLLIISDLAGRAVDRFTISGKNSSIKIDETRLENGAYFYRIITDRAIQSFGKIVIAK